MPFSLFPRRVFHALLAPTLQPNSSSWLEVLPPQRPRPHPWGASVREWLASTVANRTDATAVQRWLPMRRRAAALMAAREAFRAALDDLPPGSAAPALAHLRAARSLHELWHLRPQVFSLVARHHSQDEAARRLAELDPHFDPRRRGRGAVRASRHAGR